MFVRTDGFVLAFWGVVLPTLFLLASLVLFTGANYVRHAELSHLALQSGKSGSLVLLQALEDRAQENYSNLCENLAEEDEVPSVCSSDQISDFLGAADIGQVIVQANNAVWNNAKQFALQYDPQSKIDTGDVQVFFPFDFQHNEEECTVSLQVIITEPAQFLFGVLKSSEDPFIAVDSVVTIDLESL